MTRNYHALAIFATVGIVACGGTGGLVTVERDGGGGSAGHGGCGTGSVDTSTDDPVGKCADAGACHARQDNDPGLCAGKCAVVDDGCGTGVIYCDAVCPTSTGNAPATCGYAMGDTPACDPCAPDATVMCPPDKPNGYACKWHPIQAPCVDVGKSGDAFLGCCGGVQ